MARWANSLNLYDRIYRRNIYHFIDAYGKPIEIYKITTATCDSCIWDPINKESTRPNCSTCNGFGVVKTETKVVVKGFIDKDTGNKFLRDGNIIYQLEPKGNARITVKLDDVIDNIFVSTSDPMFRRCEKVIIEGTYYKPKDWERHGVQNLHILTVELERIREETK